MSQVSDTVITLQALDGQLEVGGVDRAPGIWPENVEYSYNGWLCDQATFDLHRDPKVIWPDLRGGGLVEIEEGGKRVWKGRIKETPSRDVDRVMSVQCEGMQYHLDDDQYERKYVHAKVSDWRDARSYLTQALGNSGGGHSAAATVGTDRGVATLMWPTNGGTWAQFSKVGVQLDLGPGQSAKRVVVEWETSDNDANVNVICRGGDLENISAGSLNDAFNVAHNGFGATRLDAGTFANPRRYIEIFMEAATTHTPTSDVWVRLKAIRVFADPAYESGNASVLKADTLFNDALDRGTLLLSSDRSLIQAPTFSVPDFAPDRPRTPREIIEAGNAWQDWLTQIDVYDRPVFKPKPTAPRLEVGAWSPMEPEDASQNSLEAIYSRVIVAATATDGSQLRVERFQSGDAFMPTDSPVPAATSASSGTGTSPRSAAIAFASGTFRRGVVYRVRLVYAYSVPSGGLRSATLDFGATGDLISGAVVNGEVTVDWSPAQDTPAASVSVSAFLIFVGATGGSVSITDLSLLRSAATLVDRRGFRRTKTLDIGFTLPTDGIAAAQLGDIWLSGHKLTPFKGQVKLTGPTAVRDMLTGLDVPLEHLGLYVGELLAFNDRADPDTAGHGRDARMVACKYNKQRDEAIVTLDNTKTNFEALLARMAIVAGGG